MEEQVLRGGPNARLMRARHDPEDLKRVEAEGEAVPAVDAAPLSTGGRAPGTPTEQTLTAIVTEVLGGTNRLGIM
jgi:hypothetical protein